MRSKYVLAAFWAIVFTVGMPWLGRGPAQADTTPPTPISLGLGVHDGLLAFDFAVRNGVLHLAWIARPAGDNQSDVGQLWYKHRDLASEGWSTPVRLGSVEVGSLRLLAADSGLHVLVGSRVGHFLSTDEGTTWKELPPILTDKQGSRSVDATLLRDKLIVAFLSPVRRAGQRPWPLGIQVIRWSRAGTSEPIILGEYRDVSFGDHPAPRLLVDGRTLTLVYGINEIVRNPAGAVKNISGRLFLSTSTDGGSTWSHPTGIGRTDKDDGTGEGTIRGLDAARLGARTFVFWDYWTLSVFVGEGGRWSSSRPVASHQSWLGWAEMSSVAVAYSGDRGRVFWVDTRYRRDDRTPTNPFAGNPFADHEWANNDVFSLPLVPSLGHADKPDRLTPDLSYGNTIRAHVADGSIYVIWSGRAKVGKRLDSFSEPPRLFLTRLPL